MKQLIIALMLSGTMVSYAQQSAQFTQYMFNGLMLNPAYAGAEESLIISFVNRAQWTAVEGSPVTQGLYAHTLLEKQKTGLGLSIINDKIGVHRNLNINGSAAYHLRISEKATLSFGLQAGINTLKSNYGAITSGSPTGTDPQLANAGSGKTSLNLGMGFYYRSPKVHAGFSIPDLIPQNYSLNDSVSITWKQANYFLFTRYIIPLSDNLQLEPGILLKYYPGLPLSFDINTCLVIKKALTLGLAYRKSESIDFLMKAQLTPQLQFGYSYDFVTGEVNNLSRGTHEIMVGYLFKYRHDKIASPR